MRRALACLCQGIKAGNLDVTKPLRDGVSDLRVE